MSRLLPLHFPIFSLILYLQAVAAAEYERKENLQLEKAIIYFSDKSTLQVEEGDYLIPIMYTEKDSQVFSSAGSPMDLWNHTQNGLIPSIMDVFAKCDFFYLKRDCNTVYNSKSIVKIKHL